MICFHITYYQEQQKMTRKFNRTITTIQTDNGHIQKSDYCIIVELQIANLNDAFPKRFNEVKEYF